MADVRGDARGWSTGPVAITGASGHVGRHVQARLARTPNEVRPLGRDADLAGAFRDADAVIHLAGTLRAIGTNTDEAANVGTVRRIVAALAGSAVRRVVYLSCVGADAASGNAYMRAKGEAERLVRACGRDAVVLRATFIVGPPDDPGPSARPSIAGPDELTADELTEALSARDARVRHLPRRFAHALAHVVPTLKAAMVDVLAADSLLDAPLASDALGLELRSLGVARTRDGGAA